MSNANPTNQEVARIKCTARVRRGIDRVLAVVNGDIESIQSDEGGYRAHGMTRAAWDEYLQAREWLQQEASRKR